MTLRSLAAALMLLPALAAGAAAQSVTLAVPAASLSFSMDYLAQDLGLFDQQGITVKHVDIAGLGAINSVIAGSSDFALASGASLTRAAARGQRLLAIVQLLDRPFAVIVMRKSLATAAGFDPAAPLAKRAATLKDRTIAVDSIDSVNHAYLRLIAKAGGLDPESVRVGVVAAPNMIPTLGLKQIDGFVMTPPWPEEALDSGDVVTVASGPAGDPPNFVPFANSVLVTRPEICAKTEAVCEKVGQAYAEAAKIMRDDPSRALAALEKNFPKIHAKAMAESFTLVRKITPMPPAPSLDAIRANETYNIDAGLLKPEEALKSYDGLFTDKYVR